MLGSWRLDLNFMEAYAKKFGKGKEEVKQMGAWMRLGSALATLWFTHVSSCHKLRLLICVLVSISHMLRDSCMGEARLDPPRVAWEKRCRLHSLLCITFRGNPSSMPQNCPTTSQSLLWTFGSQVRELWIPSLGLVIIVVTT